jgi:hypothetical protein
MGTKGETNLHEGRGGEGTRAGRPRDGGGGRCYPLVKERPCSGLPRGRNRTGECMVEAGGVSREKLGNVWVGVGLGA